MHLLSLLVLPLNNKSIQIQSSRLLDSCLSLLKLRLPSTHKAPHSKWLQPRIGERDKITSGPIPGPESDPTPTLDPNLDLNSFDIRLSVS